MWLRDGNGSRLGSGLGSNGSLFCPGRVGSRVSTNFFCPGRVGSRVWKTRNCFNHFVNKTNFNWYLVTLVLEPNKSPGYTYCIYRRKSVKVLFLVLNFFKVRVRSGHWSVHIFMSGSGSGFGSEELRVGSGLGSEIGDRFIS